MRFARVFACVCLLAGAHASVIHAADAPVRPSETPIELFDGVSLANFTSWLKETGNDDPRHVFSVEDGTIRISGDGRGYLATKTSFADYRLSLEYKWGERTDGSGFVRNSGVLLHGTGPDGSANGTWMASIEVQLAQGCEGDLIVIRGKRQNGDAIPVTLTSDTRLAADNRTRWARGGKPTKYSGRQFWWSNHQPGFEEKLDTRGREDVASKLGEWTHVECICRGDRITVKVNGVTVNECYDVFPASGKILLQNEGNEVFFRNVRLLPLPELDPKEQTQ